MKVFSGWQNFYVIVGSAGAALIGVQFVVITLVASIRKRTNAASLAAFGSPTVFHFSGTLVLSAAMTAPWPSLMQAAIALSVLGLVGLGYGVVVLRRAHRQSDYRPVFEDWLWHTMLPNVAYGAVTSSSLLLGSATRPALFAVGGAALLLLLVGIHNSWDTVIYIVTAKEGD